MILQCRQPRRRRLPGFTLVELVLSLTLMAVLLLATQSAILLASRSIPDGRAGSSALLATAGPLSQLASDLQYATGILVMAPTQVQFTVADRNGDGQPETITYAWSGTPGDPLTRQYNGGPPRTIASDVREFALVFDKRVRSVSVTSSESAELLLASDDGGTGLGAETVTTTAWTGQYFTPSLPVGPTAWRVTRIKLMAQQSGAATGQAQVQLRAASGGLPATTVLEQAAWLESSLPAGYAWQDVPFSHVSGLSPYAGLCIVVQGVANDPACDVQHCGAAASDAGLVATTDAGATWTASANQSLRFYVYGTVTTPDPAVNQYFLTAVRCALRTGGDPQARLSTSVRVLAEPQVSGP